MHYVKQFNINGVDTKQVACIELPSPPNAATEGAVGVLAMDMSSPTHEVYRCVAVNGSVYTWELLSAGMSIISATITGEGGMNKSFPYSALLIPTKYIIKVGDLILDSEGYLYQIYSIGSDSCDATYCGTHIGGIASGDKDCRLVVEKGKLQLVTESGNVISNVDYSTSDENTIYRDPLSGRMYAMGVKTINGTLIRFFVGDETTYNTLTDEQKRDVFAIFTDDKTKEEIIGLISALELKHDSFEESINSRISAIESNYLHQIVISKQGVSISFNCVLSVDVEMRSIDDILGELRSHSLSTGSGRIPAAGAVDGTAIAAVQVSAFKMRIVKVDGLEEDFVQFGDTTFTVTDRITRI